MKVKSESEVAQVVYLKVTQSCPTPRDPMDCSLPGSSVPGIFQARVLEWGAIAFSVYIYSSLCIQWSIAQPTLKPLTVWITTNWKILKEMGLADHLTCLLRNLYTGQEAAVRTDMEQ